MPDPPKPTHWQQRRLDLLYREFGRDTITLKTVNRRTGHMRIEATAAAGVWTWVFDTQGELVQATMPQRLFTPDKPAHTPGSAIDN